jgi:hypothetical protein
MILGSESQGTFEHMLLPDGSVNHQTKLTAESRVRATLRLAVCRQSVRRLKAIKCFQTEPLLSQSLCNILPKEKMGCRTQLLLAHARAVILGSDFRGTHDHILLSLIRDSPNLGGQVLIFISPRNRVTQLCPQALVPFPSLPTSLRLHPTVIRLIYFGTKHPSRVYDPIFIAVRQLRFFFLC